MKVRESNSVILLNADVQISMPDRLKIMFYKLGSEQFLETNRVIFFTSLGSRGSSMDVQISESKLKSKCTEISSKGWPRSKFNSPLFRAYREVLMSFQRFWGPFF